MHHTDSDIEKLAWEINSKIHKTATLVSYMVDPETGPAEMQALLGPTHRAILRAMGLVEKLIEVISQGKEQENDKS